MTGLPSDATFVSAPCTVAALRTNRCEVTDGASQKSQGHTHTRASLRAKRSYMLDAPAAGDGIGVDHDHIQHLQVISRLGRAENHGDWFACLVRRAHSLVLGQQACILDALATWLVCQIPRHDSWVRFVAIDLRCQASQRLGVVGLALVCNELEIHAEARRHAAVEEGVHRSVPARRRSRRGSVWGRQGHP